jgi:hypothetical protein
MTPHSPAWRWRWRRCWASAEALRETLRFLNEDLGPQARAAGWLSEDDILKQVR